MDEARSRVEIPDIWPSNHLLLAGTSSESERSNWQRNGHKKKLWALQSLSEPVRKSFQPHVLICTCKVKCFVAQAKNILSPKHKSFLGFKQVVHGCPFLNFVLQ